MDEPKHLIIRHTLICFIEFEEATVADENNQEKGEFNSGLAIIYRLDSLHKRLHTAREMKDYETIYFTLLSIFQELVKGIYKDEKKLQKHMEHWDRCEKAYFKIRENKEKNIPINSDLYNTLFLWELELSITEQTLGWGMSNKDPRFSQ